MKELTIITKNMLIIVLVILLSGLTGVVQANPGQGNQPEYQVVKPVAHIKVNPLDFSQEFSAVDSEGTGSNRQESMEVKWHNNHDREEDLRFKLNNDLVLNNSSQGNNIAHGFVNRKNSTDNVIPAKRIFISTNGGEDYQRLNEWVMVLDKEKNSNEISFKIDESWLRNNWSDITAGIYKADINVNHDRPGNQRLPRLIVKIDSAAVIDLPDDKAINLTIENPTEEKSSDGVSWQVGGNGGNYQVEFKSEGIEPKDEDLDLSINYSSFFRYSINDDPDDPDLSFAPGDTKTVTISSGELKLNYTPGEFEGNDSWFELLAGGYEDTVTVTVSAD